MDKNEKESEKTEENLQKLPERPKPPEKPPKQGHPRHPIPPHPIPPIEKLREEIQVLTNRINQLNIRVNKLENEIERLQSSGVGKSVLLSTLIESFGSLLRAKDGYVISELNVELATVVDTKDREVLVKLVSPEMALETPQAIDNIKFSIKAVPAIHPAVVVQHPVQQQHIPKMPLGSEGIKPDFIEVPRVVGLKLPEAEAVIKKAGFSVGKVEYRKSPAKSGIVIEQEPESDCVAKKGININLVVSK